MNTSIPRPSFLLLPPPPIFLGPLSVIVVADSAPLTPPFRDAFAKRQSAGRPSVSSRFLTTWRAHLLLPVLLLCAFNGSSEAGLPENPQPRWSARWWKMERWTVCLTRVFSDSSLSGVNEGLMCHNLKFPSQDFEISRNTYTCTRTHGCLMPKARTLFQQGAVRFRWCEKESTAILVRCNWRQSKDGGRGC